MKTLPILYVCRVRDTTRPWRAARAADKARAMGWLPIDPLDLWDPTTGEETLGAIRATIAFMSDAVLVVGDETTKDMQKQLESYERFGWNHIPVYGTHEKGFVAGTHPERLVLAAPPFFGEWSKAARRVEGLSGWSCASCRRFFGDDPHAERMARWCCVKETPCDGCGAMKPKTWSHCSACREVSAGERYEKLKKAPCPQNVPVYSDRDNEWYSDEDDAWSKAEQRAEDELRWAESGELQREPTGDEVRQQLREMRLLIGEPQHVDEVDLSRMTEDLLPDDNGDSVFDTLEEEIGTQVAALNEAIGKSSPLSYTESKTAVDVDATWPPAGDPPAKATATVSPPNAIGKDEGQEYGD